MTDEFRKAATETCKELKRQEKISIHTTLESCKEAVLAGLEHKAMQLKWDDNNPFGALRHYAANQIHEGNASDLNEASLALARQVGADVRKVAESQQADSEAILEALRPLRVEKASEVEVPAGGQKPPRATLGRK